MSRATRKALKINILQYFHIANELYWRTTSYMPPPLAAEKNYKEGGGAALSYLTSLK
jgi:hypothetical protein